VCTVQDGRVESADFGKLRVDMERIAATGDQNRQQQVKPQIGLLVATQPERSQSGKTKAEEPRQGIEIVLYR
jgi:hypothetical protein